MDMMWYRRRGFLMDTPHIERVTGAIASFNSDYNKIPVKSLICDIEPIQEGSGDPSPDNVRPISGRTGLTVSHSGAVTSNPVTISVNWETEAGTVYGGTLDVVSGKLVVTNALNTLNGSESINDNGLMHYGGLQVLYTPLPTKANDYPTIGSNLLSNIFTTTVSYDKPFFISGRTTNGNIYFNMPETVTTIQQARDWFSANNTQVWYKLATPIEIQLAPQEVKNILGVNNIWCDSGDVSVDYWKWGK